MNDHAGLVRKAEASLTRELDRNPRVVWTVSIGAALAVVMVAVLLMFGFGLFGIDASSSDAKVMAAAIAVVGTLLSAALTFVGTLVKFSIDDRNVRLAAVEASRSYQLARVDTVVRAVDLLGYEDRDAGQSQVGGALLALSSLGEHDLAISLLAELWPGAKTTPDVAEVVLSKALTEGSGQIRDNAAYLMIANAKLLVGQFAFYWPLRPPYWDVDLEPASARRGLAFALAEVFKEGLRKGMINPAVVLYHALEDSDPEVALVAASCLEPLPRRCDPDHVVDVGSTAVTVGEIESKLAAKAVTVDAALRDEIGQLLLTLEGLC